MARVIWDGEKIVVDSSRLDTECLDALSVKYGGERLPLSDFYQFPRSRETIMQIGALSGIVMDPSFEKLYLKVVRSEERKETELRERIAGLDLPGRMYTQGRRKRSCRERDRKMLFRTIPRHWKRFWRQDVHPRRTIVL